MTTGEPSNASFAHFIRAALAIVLALSLPFVLYGAASGSLFRPIKTRSAAVIAFYFGASAEQTPHPE
ncbi:MAG: hypothetical protein QOJ85_1640 [Solirubrobacteraceae bacterium]|jgi:TRAP-type C4-dicarboxylate transport system permease large subunit|nr:hypothetical protein [Solirubrobacteraceae bacterium]